MVRCRLGYSLRRESTRTASVLVRGAEEWSK